MNLTSLRRLVLAGNAVALLAAGASAWVSLEGRPAPRDEKEWPRLFPTKKAEGADLQSAGPGPKDEYARAVEWPQGDRPVEKGPETKVEAPKVDPFRTTYRLNGVFVSPSTFDSYAQLALVLPKDSPGFSVGMGERIPQDPGRTKSPPTPWRLNDVRLGGVDGATKEVRPSVAVFINVETEEEQTLELPFGTASGSLSGGGGAAAGGGAGIGEERPAGGPPEKDRPFRAVLKSRDAARGVVEWELPETEAEWIEFHAEDQASKISTVPAKDAEGRPDGFVLKAVAKDSRAAEYGFKAEDRVIAVNSERVNSTEQAVAVGKRQYEGGTSTFSVKVLRAGKEMNFTFHAPKKKAKK